MAKFVCKVCGYVYEGDAAPAECPVCHVGADMFEEVKGEMKLAAEHEYGIYAKTVKNNPDISDEAFEALQDEYEQLKEYLPDDDISKKDMERLSQEIKELGKELRMLRRIKKTEQEFTGRKTKQVSRVPESGTFNKNI